LKSAKRRSDYKTSLQRREKCIIGATAEIGESIRRGMIALRICDAVMQNIYAGNTGKLAAWNSASHVERDPQKAKPPTPTPTPDDDNDE